MPAQTHTLLGVAPPNAPQLFLVDVGFGGQTPTSPLRLETGSVQQTTYEPYRLQNRGDTLMLQAEIRGEWQSLYEFATKTAPPIDLQVGSWYVSTHPSSLFVTSLVAARVTADGRCNLAGRQLSIHRDGGTEKIALPDAAAVVDALGRSLRHQRGRYRGTLGARSANRRGFVLTEMRQPRPDPAQRLLDSVARPGEREPDIRTAALRIEIDTRSDRYPGLCQ